MTGYGKATRNEYGISLDIEIKSVNSKYLDLRMYFPRELAPFEMISATSFDYDKQRCVECVQISVT
jgi:uncharacterized protein YicC (UPF0701 family)